MTTDLRDFIRDVPDFPEPGIVFKDITPLLGNRAAFAAALDVMAEPFLDAGIHRIVGIESRGFLFGTPLARRFGAGFAPARKAGKLPWKTMGRKYALEYGEATLELHADAISHGERVLIVDDLLATGGTAEAAAHLVEEAGGIVVGCCFLIELSFLSGRERLHRYFVHAPLLY